MAYEVIILGHLHMPLYFLGTFTEYPYNGLNAACTSFFVYYFDNHPEGAVGQILKQHIS